MSAGSVAVGVKVAPSPRERLTSARRTLRELLHEPTFAIGLAILVVLLVLAAFGPWIAPHDPNAIEPTASLQPPSLSHLMGTDQLGRDVFSRVVAGTRLTLWIAVAAVTISTVLGTLLGLLSGYLGGVTETLIMRVMDVQLAFPGLIFALVLLAVLGPGAGSVIIAVGIGGVPTFARVTRGAVLALVSEDYITAARALGASTTRILARHVLPNVAGTIIVLATLWLAFAVLAAAALSFLGVGVRPPTPEWGAMANDGRAVLVEGWWVSFFPSLMVMLFVLAVNLAGDVLRDRLDATLRSRRAVAGDPEGPASSTEQE